MTTPKLLLPELIQSQSQPHIPINAAHRALEAVTQLSVLDRALTSPPVSPAADAYYIVGSPASGAWTGHEDDIAYVSGGAWLFLTPVEGWLAYVQDDGFFMFDGTDWVSFSGSVAASAVSYANSGSGLAATDVQAAIDELAETLADVLGSGFLDVPALSAEIMSDTPLGYWKLDEASGNFADSSGNGRTMTAAGTPMYRYGAWVPRETTKFVYFDSNGDGATRSDACGLSVPASADWTFECVAVCPTFTTNTTRVFSLTASGETEVANAQIVSRFISSTGLPNTFWEFGAGTDESVQAVVGRPQLGAPFHFAVVKDGTANTLTFYINGQVVDIISYSNEPTGGSTATSALGASAPDGATCNPVGMAHAALYSTALSQDRIREHAIAAGFMVPL